MFNIGSSLHEARTRQNLDLEEMEQRTKVRAKYLRLLEDERFDQLPGHAYTKGFLQVYADALGLDGRLYVEEYNSRFVAGEDDLSPRLPRGPARSTRRASGAPRDAHRRGRARGDPRRHRVRDRGMALRRQRPAAGGRCLARDADEPPRPTRRNSA